MHSDFQTRSQTVTKQTYLLFTKKNIFVDGVLKTGLLGRPPPQKITINICRPIS